MRRIAMVAAAPPTWTIRLKYHKTTVIVDAKPVESLEAVRSELLRALRETHKTNEIETAAGPINIPTDASEIQIAKPNDIHDHSKGWARLRIDEEEEEWDMPDELGDMKNGNKRKRANEVVRTLKEAGLKDGAILAFRFKTKEPQIDEGLGLDEAEEQWDVVIPSYDDSAGVV